MTAPQQAAWLPDTDYVELTSSQGYTFGVWITSPPAAVATGAPCPLVYVTDANLSLGLTAPLHVTQMDPLQPIAPYIQVSIGYVGEEAETWAQLRNRDLVPAGEPVAKEMADALEYAVSNGLMTAEARDAYLETLSSTDAAAFLSFITDVVHPYVCEHYAVTDEGHGLFGYSYGGLFSLYAWLTKASLFSTVGAGSPGIASAESTVFDLFEQNVTAAGVDGLVSLHITLNELEMLGPQPVYRALAQHTLRFIDLIKSGAADPLLSTAIMHDSHVTGLQASFLSYMRSLRAV